MADDLEDTIRQNAQAPAEAHADSVGVKQDSLADQIASSEPHSPHPFTHLRDVLTRPPALLPGTNPGTILLSFTRLASKPSTRRALTRSSTADAACAVGSSGSSPAGPVGRGGGLNATLAVRKSPQEALASRVAPVYGSMGLSGHAAGPRSAQRALRRPGR
jgi:hypothetical protein